MGWQDRFGLRGEERRNKETLERRDSRLLRFRDILLAANQTRGYQESLRLAGLTSPRSIAAIRAIDGVLSRLPTLSHHQFRTSPSEFNNPAGAATPLQIFWRSMDAKLRVAIIAPGFVESESVRTFDPGQTQEARAFSPDVIAAPVELWLRWAEDAQRGQIPAGLRALVVFTGLESGPLPETARDQLWRTFQVPVFEQWRGADGSVWAGECEAHDGLHVVESSAIIEQDSSRRLILTSLTDRRCPMLRVAAFTGALVTQPCECGQPGLLITDVSVAVGQMAPSALAASSQ